jgi:two-component system phosphate regulon response regulator PhoB
MQGLMMARQSLPDIIVLDMVVPAGGGAALHQRVRQLASTFAVPILIHSSMKREEIERAIPETVGTEILIKPASPADIVSAVNTALARSGSVR